MRLLIAFDDIALRQDGYSCGHSLTRSRFALIIASNVQWL
ncbi:hypothetical protein X566_03440 [Afipia sp. P52-10]|nr:hypothetical protein X566_03440 [Afipia sp. P52-10]